METKQIEIPSWLPAEQREDYLKLMELYRRNESGEDGRNGECSAEIRELERRLGA